MKFQIEEVEGGFAPYARQGNEWKGLMIAGDSVVLVEKPFPVETLQAAVLICETYDDAATVKRHRVLRVPLRKIARSFDEEQIEKT